MIFNLNTIKKFKDSYPKLQKNVLEKMPIFAFVHAEWCGHCKDALPEWKKFIKQMKSDPPPNVAILDITDDVFNYILKEHGNDFLADVLGKSVFAYPTFFYMDQKNEKNHHESTIYSYSGTRTSEGFFDFIKEHQKKNKSTKSTNSTKFSIKEKKSKKGKENKKDIMKK